MPRPKSKMIPRLVLVLGALLLGLGLAELLVRSLGLAPTMMRLDVRGAGSAFRLSENPVLGYDLKPDWKPESPRNGLVFATNSHGQRDVERSLQKSGPRILLLGDSVVQGIRTPLEQTISRQLERLLSLQGVEVLNFGVSGYNTRAEAELFAVRGRAFDPDLVLLLFVSNDQWARTNQDIGRATYERPAAVNWLLDRSDAFRATAHALKLFKFGQPRVAESENEKAMGENPMLDGLRLLKEQADAQGSKLAMLLWPSFGPAEVYFKPFLFAKSDPDIMLVELLAAKLGIETYRLDEMFRQDYAAYLDQEPESKESVVSRYTGGEALQAEEGDGMHPNALGSRLAAEAVFGWLKSHPELLPSGS